MERQRPNGILVIVVIGAVLGVLGTCGGAFGVFGQLAQSQLEDFSREMATVSSGGNDAMLQRQLEMQARMQELTAAWRGPIIAHQSLNFLASVGLLAACVLLFRWNPRAGTVFMVAVIASALIDLGGSVMQLILQQGMNAINQEYLGDMLGSDPNMPPGMDRTMGAAMSAGAGVGMCFAVFWLVAKIAYYVGSIVYLRKPGVQALLSGDAAPPQTV